MPWKECTTMSSRREFVLLAQRPGANLAQLCRNFGISRKTAYKWIERHRAEGMGGLQDRSRRPHCSPDRSTPELEAQILELNDRNPYWGSRKLRALLATDGPLPHHSTIDAILARHGRQVQQSSPHDNRAPGRFEHPGSNLLWQMDFKGHFPLTDKSAGRCHPLTILDDYSRFDLCLSACGDERYRTVQAAMQQTFERYGLPERITSDNGPPWGMCGRNGLSQLEVWLIRLGISVSHSRPYHPQTQGKDERFHRTLKYELLDRRGFNSLAACQQAFDEWRDRYNMVRPHESLGQQTPISRYRPSGRPFPSKLPSIEYPSTDKVRKVSAKGIIQFARREIYLGEGLRGEVVAIRPTTSDGVYAIYYCHKELCQVDYTLSD